MVRKSEWRKHAGVFASLFAVAAILPVLLVGATNPNALRVLTSADEEVALRLWFEPELVELPVGAEYKLSVMAEYDSRANLVPSVQIPLKSSSGLEISPATVEYPQPFTGRTKIGEVSVKSRARGTYQVEIVEGGINTTLPDLVSVVGTAKITVK